MAGTLCIGQVDAEYLIDRAAPNPSAIRDRCDEAMRRSLKDALSATLSRWCDGDDPSIWLVRGVDIDVATNTVLPSDELSDSVAHALAATLRDVLVGDGDGVESIRFADAAALLARFLVDAANGEAWSRWYYRRFRGLRMLPISAVLRSAICDDPRLGLRTLQRLTESELARVLDTLSASDCVCVRTQLQQASDAADSEQCIEACLAVWESALQARVHDAARALMLFVRASALGAGGSSLDTVIDALLDMQNVVARTPDVKITEAIGGLGKLDLVLRERIFGVLTKRAAMPLSVTNEGSYFTALGGAFLILPRLAEIISELVNPDLNAAWTEERVGFVRLLVLSNCMGKAQVDSALADPLLRFACRIPLDCQVRTPDAAIGCLVEAGCAPRRAFAAALSKRALVAKLPRRVPHDERAYFRSTRGSPASTLWLRLVKETAYQVLRAFAYRLPGFSDSGCAYLWKNFLDVAATVDIETDRIVVSLSRAPLHLVLSLTGLTRTSYVLPFGEARPFSLFTGN